MSLEVLSRIATFIQKDSDFIFKIKKCFQFFYPGFWTLMALMKSFTLVINSKKEGEDLF